MEPRRNCGLSASMDLLVEGRSAIADHVGSEVVKGRNDISLSFDLFLITDSYVSRCLDTRPVHLSKRGASQKHHGPVFKF